MIWLPLHSIHGFSYGAPATPGWGISGAFLLAKYSELGIQALAAKGLILPAKLPETRFSNWS